MNKRNNVFHLTVSAICLALCMVLPFLTGQIPQIGSMLSPMHIPVLLCGFVCGPAWAAVVGAFAPILRFALFGMPPLFPTGAAMCFELLTYGVVSGALYRMLSRFNALGINLLKLESRPIPDRDFEFMFYFDLEASVYSPKLAQLLAELETECDEFSYLGSYSEVI